VALEVTTRFALVMMLGPRTMESAVAMLGQVAGCCGEKLPLLLMDSHRPYPAAILQVFGQVLHRRRRKGHGRGRFKHKRLKPPPGLMAGVVEKVRDAAGNLLGVKTHALFGRLKDIRKRIKKFKLGAGINTAHVERFNGTARGRLARLARKTRDVSRRGTPLQAALALCRDIYNWVHPHGALDGATPAMAIGLAKEVWTMHRYVNQPVHVAPWQRAIWFEEQEKRVRSALSPRQGLKVLPTS
jgi:Integrase core domain